MEIWMNIPVNFPIFHFFFMLKWILNQRNILSEWQCLVCKPKIQQEHFIVAPMEMTKLILAWFTSTRESGNLVENCKSNIYNFLGIMTDKFDLTWTHTWNKMPPQMQIWMNFQDNFHHLIVAAIKMTKLLLYWLTSTRESGKFGGKL